MPPRAPSEKPQAEHRVSDPGASPRPGLVARVAVPGPLPHPLDYRVEGDMTTAALVGCRVRVPFRNKLVTGLVVAINSQASVSDARLRSIDQRIDQTALIDGALIELMEWCWRYYHHAPGEVLVTATPKYWLDGREPPAPPQQLRLTEAGQQQVADNTWRKRAPGQAALLDELVDARAFADKVPGTAAQRRTIVERGWAKWGTPAPMQFPGPSQSGPELNPEQAAALEQLYKADGFSPFLLLGVTGSGKTEVYLRSMAEVLAKGRQVLLLVPEIGLTPQLHRRIATRFPGVAMAVWTSSHSAGKRWQSWEHARLGHCGIVLGTRSAVFLPFRRLGLIIVDEEHDGSFKQHDGFRYHARDLAMVRGRIHDVPVLLGSATPSLETLRNVEREQYRLLTLSQRAGDASKESQTELIDLRQQPLHAGLSATLLNLVDEHLQRGEQALLFLNRRGYAPVLLCHHCGWHGDCPSCDARLTLHRRRGLLLCHHCGHRQPVPSRCPSCHSAQLIPVGQGTEQLETVLAERFPEIDIVRFDRDVVRGRQAMERQFERVRLSDKDTPMILIGTQMLAKGHHWPRLTLVGVVDSDALLFSSDFRACERLAQLLVQLAGRAGRAELPGRVVLQTHQPEHPVWQSLLSGGYSAFARQTLRERQAAGFPPYGHMALLEADAVDEQRVIEFCQRAEQALASRAGMHSPVQILGPAPAAMQRRAGRYHYQVLLLCEQRTPLHQLLDGWLADLSKLPHQHEVHWAIDVDPQHVG